MNRASTDGRLAQTAQQVARWIREADRVVIGAGSGLSAAAGLDFGDEEDFAERFPALVRRGLKAAYQMIGYSDLSEAAFWGFWAVHVMQMRFADGRNAVYEGLLRVVREKDCFVLTTNVDALFVRNGFDPSGCGRSRATTLSCSACDGARRRSGRARPSSTAQWPPSIRSRRRWRILPAFRAASTAAAASS